MKCPHSQACEPKKVNPPIMVSNIQSVTPFLSFLFPAFTANTIVTELIISMKVISATNNKGWSPFKNGKCVNTSSATGHKCEYLNRIKPYAAKNPEKVSASETRKNHIISLP